MCTLLYSAECTPQLGWLCLRQTQLDSLTQNHTHWQASSAHHLHCSLIQCFWQTLLTLFLQNHTHTDRCHLPNVPMFTQSEILADIARFARAGSHMQSYSQASSAHPNMPTDNNENSPLPSWSAPWWVADQGSSWCWLWSTWEAEMIVVSACLFWVQFLALHDCCHQYG